MQDVLKPNYMSMVSYGSDKRMHICAFSPQCVNIFSLTDNNEINMLAHFLEQKLQIKPDICFNCPFKNFACQHIRKQK